MLLQPDPKEHNIRLYVPIQHVQRLDLLNEIQVGVEGPSWMTPAEMMHSEKCCDQTDEGPCADASHCPRTLPGSVWSFLEILLLLLEVQSPESLFADSGSDPAFSAHTLLVRLTRKYTGLVQAIQHRSYQVHERT
jgi:hypothetical protein